MIIVATCHLFRFDKWRWRCHVLDGDSYYGSGFGATKAGAINDLLDFEGTIMDDKTRRVLVEAKTTLDPQSKSPDS